MPQHEHIALAELCRTPFQGDPSLVIEIVDDAPPEDPVSDSDSDEETNALEEDKVEDEELNKSNETMRESQLEIDNGIFTNSYVSHKVSNQSEESKQESKLSPEDQLSQKSKSVSALKILFI